MSHLLAVFLYALQDKTFLSIQEFIKSDKGALFGEHSI